jgi:hypothetical protein
LTEPPRKETDINHNGQVFLGSPHTA